MCNKYLLHIIEKYANTVVSTNYYMAPEVIKAEPYYNKMDRWALGCIIYELFTFNICFESSCLFGFVNKITEGKHGKIDMNKYNLKWQNLIDLLLIKNYKERPNIEEVYNYLNNDIKEVISKNIINEDNKIKIGDFGISKQLKMNEK